MALAGADGVEKLEDMIVRSAETTATHIAAAKAAVGNVIFGQEHVVERTLITVLCGGHGMLVGVPGLAKTKLVEALGTVLDRAGHDPSSPTCWIWEGVVMYLTREAMHSTLASVADRSARGSTLIVSYHSGRRGFFARLVYRLIGEPQISAWTREEMAADLESAGFVVREDSGMADWNRRFALGEAKVERASYMRIAIGVSRALTP